MDNDVDEDFRRIEKKRIEVWITLTHVCRRWRSVVFYSPRHLNLRLVCTFITPARDTLAIWPPLPLIICNGYWDDPPALVKNTIAALRHNDRVCQIDLGGFSQSQLEYIANSALMQKPFPVLTDLRLHGPDIRSIPASFLGGTAPHLRSLRLSSTLFPGLRRLLLSTTHLVHLDLHISPLDIPPEAMAAILSALTSLESHCIHFLSPLLMLEPALESRRPPCSILPRLTKIEFNGPGEYLEEILARIDVPRLSRMYITFFDDTILDTPELFQFISRTPTLRALEKAQIAFYEEAIIFKFSSQTSDFGGLRVEIPCTVSGWQFSSFDQAWTSSLPPVPTLKDLYILEDRFDSPCWQDDVENTLWLDFLRSFVAVKNLYLPEEYVIRFAPVLQELVGGRTTEVLPTLENIFLEAFQPSGPLHEGIERFVAARRLMSQPVAVFLWDKGSKREERRQFDIDYEIW